MFYYSLSAYKMFTRVYDHVTLPRTKSSKLGLAEYNIYRDVVVCQHTIAAAPPLRHAIALHLRYAKSRGKWQR